MDRLAGLKVATVFGLWDVVMPAASPIVAAVITFGVFSVVLTLMGLKLGAKLGLVTGERGEFVARSCCSAGRARWRWTGC